MSMTIESSVKDKILATPSETSKVENAPAKMLRDLDQQMEKRVDDGCTLWIKLYSKYEYEIRYHPGKANVVIEALRRKERVKPRRVRAIAMTISPVLWAEIRESSLTGPELVLDMTDKVVLIKEKLKAARDRQKSYADNRRKPLEFEVGDRVMLKVSPWKGVIRFGKKGKLAPSLHVPLDEIKVDKTLRFVEEPVENSDREVKRFLTSLLDDGRGSGSWMFLFVWSGYAAMRTLCGQAKLLALNLGTRFPKGGDTVTTMTWAVSMTVSLLWIVDSERDRLIVVRFVSMFVIIERECLNVD
ncbi:hypothetical protein Tco_1129021 [Tanacetum coccineum]